MRVLLPQSHHPKGHMLLQSATKALYHTVPNPGAAMLPILGALASSLANAPLAPPTGAAAPRGAAAEDNERLRPEREESELDEGSLCERLVSMRLFQTATPAAPLAPASDRSPGGMNTGAGCGGATAAMRGSSSSALACKDIAVADARAASFFTVLGMAALEQLRLTERSLVRLRRHSSPSTAHTQVVNDKEGEGGDLAAVTAGGSVDVDDVQVCVATLAWLAVASCHGDLCPSCRGHSLATLS